MKQEEIDAMLQVIENPIRRKIIKVLSQEPCYALQLSKELGLGQPLVAKHLGIMEAAGLVSSMTEKSPAGPPRKKYALAKSVSLTMDVAPNLYIERGVAFDPAAERKPVEKADLGRRVRSAANTKDCRDKISLLSQILSDVDRRMGEVEAERVQLLQVRNQAMREASKVASELQGFDRRRVLFHILDAHDMEVEAISESLNMRELAVKAILEELERNLF